MPYFKFWNERWENRQIGFHLDAAHQSLVKFIDLLSTHENVFVPLCGKSLDMIYLRQHGHKIVGVEFSEIAVMEFIKENNLSMKKTVLNHFNLYEGDGFKIYQGDLFNLTSLELSGVTACYDRASMVALDHSTRIRYGEFLINNASDLKIILTPLLDYGNIEETLPPYSVTSTELNAIYGKHFDLKELGSMDIPIRDSLRERGAVYEREVTWLLTRKI